MINKGTFDLSIPYMSAKYTKLGQLKGKFGVPAREYLTARDYGGNFKRALFIGNQLVLVSVYTSVENDKKVLDWF